MLLESLQRLAKILNENLNKIVDAIEKEDPTTKKYIELLDSYNASITIAGNINRTLAQVEANINAVNNEVKEGE